MKLKMRIKQWLRDFLHTIVWDDLGLRVIKRELDDTWQVVQDLKYQVRKLIEVKEVMFNDSDNGQTQYCEECLKKQQRIDELEKENKELKEKIAEAISQIAFYGSRYGFGSDNIEKYNKDWEDFNKALNLIREEFKEIDKKVKSVGENKC